MKPVCYQDVVLKSGFLHEKQELNKSVTMQAVYKRFEETGRFKAFDCDWQEGMEQKPSNFWDSDVAKWLEAAAYILHDESDPQLEQQVETLIDKIEENQGEDGYFNIYYTVCAPGKRFTDRDMHELYCAGHLFEAAVAYFEATGRDRFLKLMEKYADYIHRVFVIEKSAAFITPGHPEIELALVRMYRATGKRKFLDLAAFFINNRGVHKEKYGLLYFNEYFTYRQIQSHLPVREQEVALGHCVRACYLYAAMADLAFETKDNELYRSCKALFDDIVEKKMYITGGIGQTRFGEAFTVSYDLKNDAAYAETCAAISLMFFAQRMLQFENDAKYAEVIERILYNGMISGLSLTGDTFFYENPLEIDLKNCVTRPDLYPITTRVKVFECSCCPPNLNRVLASLGGYIYGHEEGTVYVNQFVGSEARIGEMYIRQESAFPKDNRITLVTANVSRLCIRLPRWSAACKINADYRVENGYAVIERPVGEITVEFCIAPFLVQSNPAVYENNGKAAVCCGPYVCAAEGIDNIENLHSLFIDKSFKAEFSYSEEMKGFAVKVKAYRRMGEEALYSAYSENFEEFTLTMIPYAAFANRGESNMCVWLNVR